jgi:hypothetical protein
MKPIDRAVQRLLLVSAHGSVLDALAREADIPMALLSGTTSGDVLLMRSDAVHELLRPSLEQWGSAWAAAVEAIDTILCERSQRRSDVWRHQARRSRARQRR